MKKTLLAFVALFVMNTAIVAQDVKSITGKYTGDLYISLMMPVNEETEAITDQKVEITAGEMPGTVDFALYNFAFADMHLGDILLPGISITDNGGVYTFGAKEAVEFDFAVAPEQHLFASAALNPATSSIQNSTLLADIDVLWHAGEDMGGDIPIYVQFRSKDFVSGINEVVTAKPVKSGVYTLCGIRVANKLNSQLPKGLYIVDGKKTFVK